MSASWAMAFGQNDRIVFRGVDLRWKAECDGGHMFRLANDPDVLVAHSHETLWSARTDDQFTCEPNYYLVGRAKARLRSGVETLADVPQREHALMQRKHFICQAVVRLERERDALRATRAKCPAGSREAKLLSVSRGDAGLRAALDLVWPEVEAAEFAGEIGQDCRKHGGRTTKSLTKYGPQVVRDWLVLLDKNDWDILSLRMKYRNSGRHEPQISLDCERLMNACAVNYAHESKPTLEIVYGMLESAIHAHNGDVHPERPFVTLPSKRTFYKRIRDMEPFSVFAARHGIKKAKQKFKVVTQGTDVERPGERVEMDEMKLHLHTYMETNDIWKLLPEEAQKLVLRRRPWVCLAKDVATKCVLGMSVSMEASTDSVLNTIRMIVSDKSRIAAEVGAKSGWGMAIRPSHIYTDNGSTMVNSRTGLAMAGLGIKHERTIAGEPQMRGNIESIMRVPNSRLFPLFTGNSFSNVVARGDYPAEKRASMTVIAIVNILFRHLLDDYHNRPHRGLGGETPANAWKRLMHQFPPSPLPDRDTLRSIFGVQVQRVIGPHGVAVFGLHYQSTALQDFHRQTTHGATIAVKVDCNDLGRVSARLGDTWYSLDCATSDMKGTSLPVFRDTMAALRATHARDAMITRPILLEAMKAAQALARQGLVVFGLTESWTTAEEIRRAEDAIYMGYVMPTTAAPPPLLSGSVAATGPDVPYAGDQKGGAASATSSVEDDKRFTSRTSDPYDDPPAVLDGFPPEGSEAANPTASNTQHESRTPTTTPAAVVDPGPEKKLPGARRSKLKVY